MISFGELSLSVRFFEEDYEDVRDKGVMVTFINLKLGCWLRRLKEKKFRTSEKRNKNGKKNCWHSTGAKSI